MGSFHKFRISGLAFRISSSRLVNLSFVVPQGRSRIGFVLQISFRQDNRMNNNKNILNILSILSKIFTFQTREKNTLSINRVSVALLIENYAENEGRYFRRKHITPYAACNKKKFQKKFRFLKNFTTEDTKKREEK
jgi:hypothetical protein